MFIAISRMTSFPRHLAWAVSVCQIGAVAVFIPLPILNSSVFCWLIGVCYVPKDNTSNKHLRKTIRSTLDQSANRHDDSSHDDGLFTTEPFTDSKGDQGTDKTSNVVDGCDGG